MERKPISLEEHKKIMLNILVEFANFCDEHGLMYYLDAGTLIGAVRHKGFIPWDDDIDVNMPQKDYDRFVEIMRERRGKLTDYLMVEFPENILYSFIKITDTRTALIEFPNDNPMEVGVYIDVFPKYGVKDSSWKSRMACWIAEQMNNLKWFCHYSVFAWQRPGHNFILRSISFIGRLTMAKAKWPAKLQNWYLHLYAKNNPLEKCEYVTTMVYGEFHKIAPKDCFDGFQWLEFEGVRFKGPKDFDTYLHCLYKGDYMQLPPEDKRVHHNVEVYWK